MIATATPVLGAGLEGWLEGARPGWRVSAVVSDRALLEKHLHADISLVVASACLGGVLVAAELVRIGKRVPLLVLVTEPNVAFEADLLRAGAMAVLHVRASREELVRVAAELIDGRSVASADAIRLLAKGPAAVPDFTERQREILRALADGQSTQDIARDLVVTQSTVKTHIGRLAARLGLSGRHELQARAADLMARGALRDLHGA